MERVNLLDTSKGKIAPNTGGANEKKKRQCVYISSEVHDALTSLVRKLVDNGQDLSVGGFANMIIGEFLQKNKKKINELYREDPGDLINF